MQQLPEIGHFARACSGKPNNTKKRINYLEDMTSEQVEEECQPKKTCLVTQWNKITPNNNDHYGVELK